MIHTQKISNFFYAALILPTLPTNSMLDSDCSFKKTKKQENPHQFCCRFDLTNIAPLKPPTFFFSLFSLSFL
eukprot:m.288320 g.288320  ORF g.288320 m.288320 type:complete len:72 (-) comp171532_c0_seq1:79-294(-)